MLASEANGVAANKLTARHRNGSAFDPAAQNQKRTELLCQRCAFGTPPLGFDHGLDWGEGKGGRVSLIQRDLAPFLLPEEPHDVQRPVARQAVAREPRQQARHATIAAARIRQKAS